MCALKVLRLADFLYVVFSNVFFLLFLSPDSLFLTPFDNFYGSIFIFFN